MGRAASVSLRILKSAPTRIVAGLVWVVAFVAGVQALVKAAIPGASGGAANLVGAVLLCGAAAGAYALFVRFTEKRWPRELRGAWPDAVAGLALGAGLFSATVGILWLMGAYRVEAVAPASEAATILAAALSAALVSAVVEEVLARGVLFRIAQGSIGSWGAIALSALLFGLAHLGNPHATIGVSLGLALQAGVLLGAAFMLTGRLWLPIGLHLGWNFVQAGVFGGALSGGSVHAMLTPRLSGPAWLCGGEFGVEGSVVATMVCATTAAGMLLLAARRGRSVPPFWRRPAALAA